MTVPSIQRKRISDQIFDQMKDMIENQKWKIGEKIPSEVHLMEMFDVSRITIREAIRQLVCLGMLESRQGSGTYVCSHHESAFGITSIPSKQDLLLLLEVRRAVEIECASLSALRATDDDIQALKSICDHMNQEGLTSEAYSALDMEFHTVIARSARNKYITEVMGVLTDPLFRFFNTSAFLRFSKTNGMRRHSHILSAIENHNAQEARLIMELHMNETIRSVDECYREKDVAEINQEVYGE